VAIQEKRGEKAIAKGPLQPIGGKEKMLSNSSSENALLPWAERRAYVGARERKRSTKDRVKEG
jgi:hypothetical protein